MRILATKCSSYTCAYARDISDIIETCESESGLMANFFQGGFRRDEFPHKERPCLISGHATPCPQSVTLNNVNRIPCPLRNRGVRNEDNGTFFSRARTQQRRLSTGVSFDEAVVREMALTYAISRAVVIRQIRPVTSLAVYTVR